jgi:hypothetical protein
VAERPRLAELLRKLRLVERALPRELAQDSDYRGIRVDENGSELSITLASAASPLAGALARALAVALGQAQLRLAPNADGGRRLHGIAAGDAAYRARCASADFGAPANREAGGTLGWFFWLDGRPFGIGSYHVFCADGDRTVPGSICAFRRDPRGREFDRRVGRLWHYDRADTRLRLYDCALILIDDPSSLSGAYRRIAGVSRPYPLQLGSDNLIMQGERFYIVGAGSTADDVRDTLFRGVGSARFAVPPTGESMLHEQLFFDARTANGDSGAVVVHAASNAVVGLVAGGGGAHTIASPLYRKPWRYAGVASALGVSLPAFHTH